MTHDAFYMIEPRPELASYLLGRTDSDFAAILTETLLIRNRESDRSTWTTEDHAAKIKLLFLARLREYDPLSADDDAARLLGSDRISIQLFDRWWVARRVDVEDDSDGLLAFLRPVLSKVITTGNPSLDSWLAWVCDPASQGTVFPDEA